MRTISLRSPSRKKPTRGLRDRNRQLQNLHGLGHALVALRIALGLTQRELSERLGVHESQVSRDERNEYHGITVERASRILDALGVQLHSAFEQPIVRQDRSNPAAGSRSLP